METSHPPFLRVKFLDVFFLVNSVVVKKQIVKVLTISHCLCSPLKVADRVVMMDCYSCRDVTDKAKVKE